MSYIRDMFLSLEKIGYFVGPLKDDTVASDVDANPADELKKLKATQDARTLPTESMDDELKRMMR